jgi:hypothetical protein
MYRILKGENHFASGMRFFIRSYGKAPRQASQACLGQLWPILQIPEKMNGF